MDRARPARPAQRRHRSDEALSVHIRAVYAYGWSRLWRQRRVQGIRVGKLLVQRLMHSRIVKAASPREAFGPRRGNLYLVRSRTAWTLETIRPSIEIEVERFAKRKDCGWIAIV
jgi:hypothetical protein